MHRLHDVSSHGVLLAKTVLEEKSKTKLPWFEYLQVAHLFRDAAFQSELNRDLTMFAFLLRDSGATLRGFISKCYRSLKARAWDIVMTFQKAWNIDCAISTPEKIWPRVWSSPLVTSKSLLIKLQFTKTIVR